MIFDMSVSKQRSTLVLILGIVGGSAWSTGLGAQPVGGVAQHMPAIVLPDAGSAHEAVANGPNDQISSGDPDADRVMSAVRDMQAKGIKAVVDHEGELAQVIADMPRPFRRTSIVDGHAIYRADSADDCRARTSSSGASAITCRGNPFPMAGMLLASFYDEFGHSDRALTTLDAVLPAAPGEPHLILERGAALAALHRWPEMLANADHGLTLDGLEDRDKARFFRSRGYALTELKRLDEAEAAYKESLKWEPGNELAQHELTYIAGLRAGGAASPGGQLTSVQHPPN